MKVFAISDLHLSTTVNKPMDIFGPNWSNHFLAIKEDWEKKVSDEDVVLMPGDFSWAIKSEDAESDFALFKELKGKKVILRGNHDFWWNTISQVRAILPEGFFAIQNDALKFGNLIVCGSRGWVLPEPNRPLNERDNKIYLREIERIKLSLAAMEKLRQEGDRVICIMHYPPFNGRREESEFVRQLILHGVDTVVYGHLRLVCQKIQHEFLVDFRRFGGFQIDRNNLTTYVTDPFKRRPKFYAVSFLFA